MDNLLHLLGVDVFMCILTERVLTSYRLTMEWWLKHHLKERSFSRYPAIQFKNLRRPTPSQIDSLLQFHVHSPPFYFLRATDRQLLLSTLQQFTVFIIVIVFLHPSITCSVTIIASATSAQACSSHASKTRVIAGWHRRYTRLYYDSMNSDESHQAI